MGKRGNLFDGILWAEGLAQQKKEENLPSQIYDYPETVLDILILFEKLWMLPPNAIPSKQLRGRFAQWVLELQQLYALTGDRYKEILPIANDVYWKMNKRFIVSHPLAIKSLVIQVMSEENRRKQEEESKSKPISKLENKSLENGIISNSEDTRNSLKNLKYEISNIGDEDF